MIYKYLHDIYVEATNSIQCPCDYVTIDNYATCNGFRRTPIGETRRSYVRPVGRQLREIYTKIRGGSIVCGVRNGVSAAKKQYAIKSYTHDNYNYSDKKITTSRRGEILPILCTHAQHKLKKIPTKTRT